MQKPYVSKLSVIQYLESNSPIKFHELIHNLIVPELCEWMAKFEKMGYVSITPEGLIQTTDRMEK